MDICDDVLNIVANYLPLKNAIELQYLSKSFILRPKHYIFNKYNDLFLSKHFNSIQKLEICNSSDDLIYDTTIFKFVHLKHVSLLGNISLTDDGLKHLMGIHTLNLYRNKKITDDGLKHLTGIHTLNLYCNKNITDGGLKHLTGIHTLNLSNNENITDGGLKHLTSIHTLNLSNNENITDGGLKH